MPLRIFEPKYYDMVANRAQCDEAFGVVLSKQDNNDPKHNIPGRIGTSVRIIDFESLPNGILGITCLGERRFINEQYEQQTDGLWQAHVTYLEQASENTELPSNARILCTLLKKFYPQLGSPFTDQPMLFNEAEWVGNRLCELLPLNFSTKEKLLRIDNPIERLTHLTLISDLMNNLTLDE